MEEHVYTEMDVEELEEYKWGVMIKNNSFESRVYAMYIQNLIDESLMGMAKQMIDMFKDGSD